MSSIDQAVVEIAGVPVPAHFGAPDAEYQAIRRTVGVADRGDRARIRMWGKDPVRMLQGLITNDLQKAAPGAGVYGAMLTPKGRTIADLRAFRTDAGEVLIELSREALAGAADHLRKFVPPMFAKWSDASESNCQLGAYGPLSGTVVSAALNAEIAPLAEDAYLELRYADLPVIVAGTREVGLEEGFDLFVPAEAAPALLDALTRGAEAAGGRRVGFLALETLRMEAGRPRYGAELTEEVIPTEAFEETGLMPRAISFHKGCYTGQEVIVRIAHRGHVNRHLRGLLLGETPPPEAGTRLFHAETGKEVGRVTGATHSPLMAQTIALGYLRREVMPGATVHLGEAGGPPARVAQLPFAPSP
jgi:folate-binding protein YgfZ